jgi:hypothetical protein
MARCSCKLFESHGVPCRHIIQVLRAEKLIELPDHYIMIRWQKRCKRFVFYMPLCNCDMFYSSDILIPFFCRAVFFDDDGNILEDVPADPVEVAMRKKKSDARNMFEDLIHMAKQSNEGMDFLTSSLSNLQVAIKDMVPSVSSTKQDEIESFIGAKIPNEVVIHPPNDLRSKGDAKELRKARR